MVGVRLFSRVTSALAGVSLTFCLCGETIRVASINLQNYLIMDRLVEGEWKKQYPKPEKEKRALRAIIKAVDADVLALQEIGERPFLNELWMDLNVTSGPVYPYALWMPAADDEEERHLALLSKIPFSSVRLEHDLDFVYFGGRKSPDRGLMEVEFQTKGTKWKLFNLHLKSKWTERKEDPGAGIRREKEARTIRDYLRKTSPPAGKPLYLVVGDLTLLVKIRPLPRAKNFFPSRWSCWLLGLMPPQENWLPFAKLREVIPEPTETISLE